MERLNSDCKALLPFSRLPFLVDEIDHENLLITTSFGKWSGLLLSAVCNALQEPTVHFINTGYHFRETLEYKKTLESLWGINVVEVYPSPERHRMTKQQRMWQDNPHECCNVNKVEPLNRIKNNYSFWVSGLMGWQTPHRSSLNIIHNREDIVRIHPLIDLTEDQAILHFDELHVPRHPLANKGFESIGCSQCTHRGKSRTGRWSGHSKTECGLHL